MKGGDRREMGMKEREKGKVPPKAKKTKEISREREWNLGRN